MNTTKNISSNGFKKKTTSALLNIFQSLGIIFIGVLIVNFIVKW